MRFHTINLFVATIIFLQTAYAQNTDLIKKISDFYSYRISGFKSETPDQIARLFVADPLYGSVLIREKISLKDFLAALNTYSKNNPAINFKEKLDQTDFLNGFAPNNLPQLISEKPQTYADVLKPYDKSIPYDGEQIIKGKDFEIDKDRFGALNMNADLGVQYTIRKILYPDILMKNEKNGDQKPTFVIISSGHAIAGLAAMAQLTKENSDGTTTCLFDTSAYMPMGTWKESTRTGLASEGAAIWGQSIANAKKKCTSYAGESQ